MPMLYWGRVLICALIVSSTGCATLGWRLWPNTRSYQYDREVTVEVHSSPEGATVVGEDGKPLGIAPFTYRTHHKVERVRRSRSGRGMAVGCALDLAASAALFYAWGQNADFETGTHLFDSTRQRVLMIGGLLAVLECGSLASLVGMIKSENRRGNGLEQTMEPLDRRDTVRESVIPRPITLEARWLDWSPTRTTLTLPADSLVTLHRAHAGSFDDALVRHARAGFPLGHDGLLRAGRTYHRMAIETKDPAHVRAAVSYFERYLAGDVVAERRIEIEKSIDELRRMAGQ